MDKKNTMLLTVIAVATLLVAVVGATFVYFSISVTNSQSETNITGNVDAIGLVTITTEKSALKLDITADLMAKSVSEQGDVTYYATVDGKPLTAPQEHQIFKVAVTGGADSTNYECKAQLKISTAEDDTLHSEPQLEAGDVGITLKGIGIDSEENIDLFTDLSSNSYTKDLTFKITGNNTAYLKADAKLVNKKDGDIEKDGEQNYLAGKKLSLKLELGEATCNPVASE